MYLTRRMRFGEKKTEVRKITWERKDMKNMLNVGKCKSEKGKTYSRNYTHTHPHTEEVKGKMV